ncbi:MULTISPECIES: tRNA (adenosine(37)-N6)-threonylcarbamoyltransferase complex ATPase subunit type 1 TsaE [unclassified Psychrobacter]|uniref:tRNA (adenosine(37)-N6)-threonylcarbamoyltransferase complex ATPase subunit type 1 TsaE n=1 Tax=unclassified Psychrobacter TaxID=196806 RepID=UPI0018F5A1ED|nr:MULTISPECIES: tRNA (adenosine(37)-N6)-threonylcarbamoyltransferase complex ATPase subunit type 1 TsaE [unclassified Psychrobacter]
MVSNANDNPAQTQHYVLHSENDTEALAHMLADLPLSGSVWLSGDLGAGKTTLTRYWLRALGHKGAVKSPTYTLVEPYQIAHAGQYISVYHADLYRLQDPEELSFIGFDDYLDEPHALVLIEWASRAEGYLPPPMLSIKMRQQDDGSRAVTLILSDAAIEQGVCLPTA